MAKRRIPFGWSTVDWIMFVVALMLGGGFMLVPFPTSTQMDTVLVVVVRTIGVLSAAAAIWCFG